jgi:phosphatidate cytidylyltransferase
MLSTRLWMGSLLIGLAAGVIVGDQYLEPWYPFLLIYILFLVLGSCVELRRLLLPEQRPPLGPCLAGIATVIASNWVGHLLKGDAWQWLTGTFAAVVLVAFLLEMARFHGPSGATNRLGLTVLVVAYLGLLPSFLVQLRWPASGDISRGTLALALAIFVPKSCDIGAYFVGKFLGRRQMAPVLSPKKTWEGALAGVVTAAATAVLLDRLFGPILSGIAEAAAFGVVIGTISSLGDLAESLLKRDGQSKDSSTLVPGFGGLLDVIDSVVFSVPIAYWWLRRAGA